MDGNEDSLVVIFKVFAGSTFVSATLRQTMFSDSPKHDRVFRHFLVNASKILMY